MCARPAEERLILTFQQELTVLLLAHQVRANERGAKQIGRAALDRRIDGVTLIAALLFAQAEPAAPSAKRGNVTSALCLI